MTTLRAAAPRPRRGVVDLTPTFHLVSPYPRSAGTTLLESVADSFAHDPATPRSVHAHQARYWSEFPTTVRVDDRLVFVADDGISGPERWSTDGTAAGTELVHDLWSGPKGLAPERLVAANGALSVEV
jgi:ELWxxDGT repeat protein